MILSLVSYLEYKNKSSSIFLWATLMLMFGVMHLITVIIGKSGYSTSTINGASIFVILFSTLYLITRLMISFVQVNKTTLNFEKIDYTDNKLFSILFILLIVSFAIKNINFIKFTGGVLNSSWGEYREYSQNLDYVNGIKIVDIIFSSLSGLLLFSYYNRKKIKFLIVFLIYAVNTIIFRHRIAVLPILCSVIAIYLFRIKKVNFVKIITIIMMSIIVIYIVYGLRVLRYYGTIDNLLKTATFKDFNTGIINFIINDDGELSLRKLFYYFIENNNNFAGFGKGATYKRMLFVLIPTKFSFGLKPDDFAITMGSAMGMRYGGSVHPTLFGDAFANYGYYGVFTGIFWALYASIIDYIVRGRSKVIWIHLHYILNAICFVTIGRGSVYNSFFNMIYGTLTLLLLEFILDHFKLTRNKQGKLTIFYIKKI